MKTLLWPDMFNYSLTQVVSDKDAAKQSLKLLLLSELGTLWSDPGYGIVLQKFIFDLGSSYLVSIIRRLIYDAIVKYIPLIFVRFEDITLSKYKSKLIVNIVYSYVEDSTSDMLSIELILEN